MGALVDIRRATVILDTLAESAAPLTLTEITDRTGLPRSSVHRMIQAFELALYVSRDPRRGDGYILGPGLLKFGMNAYLRLLGANRSRLVGLARAVNENVELAIFSGREVVVVDQVASPQRLKGVTRIGRSFSLHASAIGKALLAQLPDEQVAELLRAPLASFTARTIVDGGLFAAELQAVRSTRVAIDIEEHDIGICAVATGMTAPGGTLQAISVVMPTQRFAAKRDRAIEGLRQVNPDLDARAAIALYSTR